MRVEIKKPVPVFEEIHIVLESKEEAKHMWHLMDKAKTKNLVQYCQEYGLNVDNVDAFAYKTYVSLNNVFHVKS